MILVTGGTGLVGAHLLLHLIDNGEKVRALYRDSSKIALTKSLFNRYQKDALFNQIEWFLGDITDIPSLEIAFQNIQQVYHCAALISFDRKDEDRLRKTNIEGTANMVNLSIANQVKKFCFVSSVAALGDLKEHETQITETTEWNSEKHHSDYAISKYGAEVEIWRGQQEGLQTVIVNPGVILGPGFWNHGSGAIFTAIANHLPFYTKGSTGFVAVTDVVAIMYLLMKSDANGERFTVVAGNYVFQDILNSIADALKVKRPQTHLKPWMTAFLWRIDWIAAMVFRTKRKLFKEISEALHTTELYSNVKLVSTLHFQFKDMTEYISEVIRIQKN